MKDFYLVLKAKVEAGQYILEDMVKDIQLAYEKGRITLLQLEELNELAAIKVDLNYQGNKYPRPYDLEQDIVLLELDASMIEMLDMMFELMGVQTATQKSKLATFNMAGRSIASSYVRLIVAGRKTFDQVQPMYKREVADKLIEIHREDLITDPEYLPKVEEEIDPEFGVSHE